MRRILAMLVLVGCAVSQPSGTYQVVQADVMGHRLSCKGALCCWPWDDGGRSVTLCIRPDEEGRFGVSGAIIVIRGKTP